MLQLQIVSQICMSVLLMYICAYLLSVACGPYFLAANVYHVLTIHNMKQCLVVLILGLVYVQILKFDHC